MDTTKAISSYVAQDFFFYTNLKQLITSTVILKVIYAVKIILNGNHHVLEEWTFQYGHIELIDPKNQPQKDDSCHMQTVF
jgi:hypothetical protein